MSSWQPPTPPEQPSGVGVDYSRAQSQVSAPAIALIVVAALAILSNLLSLVLNLLGTGIGTLAGSAPDERFVSLFSGGVGIVTALVGIVVYGVMIFGAVKMKALESYALAITAAIIAMLPCSCCCLIGLPIGIWALVVLVDANVKAAFRS